MHNSEFEKRVQQQMEELKLPPGEAVWQKVEAALPKEKKRRWLIWFFLLAVSGTSIALLLNNKQHTNSISSAPALKDSNQISNIAANKNTPSQQQGIINTPVIVADLKETKDEKQVEPAREILPAGTEKKPKIAGNRVIIGSSISVVSKNENLAARKKAMRKIRRNDPAKAKMEVSPADTEDPAITSATEKQPVILKKDNAEVAVVAAEDTSTVTESKKEIAKKEIPAIPDKQDSSQKIAIAKPGKKNKKSPWEYGIYLGAGISNTSAGNLMQKSYPLAYSNSNPIPNNGVGSVYYPQAPAKGTAFAIGFYAEKKIAAKWNFTAGLGYTYLSTHIKTGEKVDTVANYNPQNKNDGDITYYSRGNSVDYKNKYHLLQMPLLFQYHLSAKSRVYIEAGPTIGYLIHSDALVYNANPVFYFTYRDVFNKLLLSFTTGVGVNLAQRSRFPFTVGSRFEYGIGSVMKKSFGIQHPVSALLYLKIPLKK